MLRTIGLVGLWLCLIAFVIATFNSAINSANTGDRFRNEILVGLVGIWIFGSLLKYEYKRNV